MALLGLCRTYKDKLRQGSMNHLGSRWQWFVPSHQEIGYWSQKGVVRVRSSGCRHLLSDAHDPFNRMPLKEEDLIPNLELKARIEAWKAEMHEQARRKVES